ncbi:MAG TPA: glycosyltransferase family 4 protein [Actinomycetota bacterium]|nr:glycosyltransferase family 4 protein [Actinomycetota bacterium]
MRVALVCPYAWDAPGGVQVHVRQLAERLRGLGHATLVVAPADGRRAEPGVVRTGGPIRVRVNRSVAPIAPWPAAARRRRDALGAFRPDIVHVHEPFVPGAAGAVRDGARLGAATVGTFHAYADRAPLLDVTVPLLRSTWSALDRRIAVSRAAAAFVARRFRGGVRVVPNGVETRLFAEADPVDLPPGRRVLFVNRLDPRKGFGVMVRAFEDLRRTHPDALLVVAGDGPERGAVGSLEPETRARVVLLGNVAHRDLPRVHAACEIFCAPAVGHESFGIVLVEAMAAGLPVVASDIPGYREVVRDGVDGVLVPPRAPAATAAALRRLLDDPAVADGFRAAGRQRAGRFGWETVAAEILGIYEEALRER